jgi:hypothetical protein
MHQHSPEIIALRQDVETSVGYALHTPNDFQYLIHLIWERQHTVLSLSTIKRLWGYIDSNANPRVSTLNTLSQFLGYTDWNAYLASLDLRAVVESDLFCGEGICASDLSEGDRVQVEWLPNRRCVFRFLGENQFVVQESLRSKLSVDDTFETAAFIVGKPLYLSNLQHFGSTSTSYVAGKKNGLTSVIKL